jgi:RHS repeat-associated protein
VRLLKRKNYYPFGLQHKGYNFAVNGREHNYGFNGIELTESLELNLYEMDLRKYDPAIARWTGIDPVTHHSMSTYNAFDNNPILIADPSGADGEIRIQDLNGNWHEINSNDYTTIYQSSDNESESESNEECCGGYLAAYKHKESSKERNYYNNNSGYRKVIRGAAYDAGVLATRVSNELGGDNLGYSGAIRHSYWMYLVAVNLSPEIAEIVGHFHEDFIIGIGKYKGKNNLTTRDSKMDMVNNAWGIDLASKNVNLDYLGFEELFYKDVKNNNTAIMILDSSTIPQQTLRATFEYRRKIRQEVKQEMKATEHLRLPSIKD